MASEKMKISYVVLHYKTFKDTIACVESITNLKNVYQIIIVDNFSNDGSTEIIEKHFKNLNNLIILKSNSNLGYAKGNNIGYQYAKKCGADFIVLANNDVIFEDKSFCNSIVELYEKYSYGVMGPDIVDKEHIIHQNPLVARLIDNKLRCLYMILRYYIEIVLVLLSVDGVTSKIRNKKIKSISELIVGENLILNQITDMNLNGSCLIFSKKYIERFEGLFDKTFMYYEELILKYLCIKNNLSILYSPSTYVVHIGQSSTSHINANDKQRKIFKYKQSIESLKQFYKIL